MTWDCSRVYKNCTAYDRRIFKLRPNNFRFTISTKQINQQFIPNSYTLACWKKVCICHNIAIDIYQITQGKIFSEKPDITPICGFFQHFLALHDTFTTRCNYSGIKFEFSGYLYHKNTLFKNIIWKWVRNALRTSVKWHVDRQ